MPDMTPIANTIIPPDPSKGIKTLSGIIGLQQQRQALQTGQYQQQSAAAAAQSAQLATQGQQESAQFFKKWDPTEHMADDGTLDLDSALTSPNFKSAGPGKTAIMENLLKIKNSQLANKQSLAGLNSTLINQLGTQIGALAKDDDVVADKTDPKTGVNAARAKIDQYFDNFSKLSPDAARVAAIYRPMVDHAPPGKLSTGIQSLQLQAQDVAGQQAFQSPKPGSINVGGRTLLTTTNPSTGIQTPTGQSFEGAPHQVSNAAGNIVNVSPTGVISTAPTAGPPGTAPGGANPTTAQATVQNVAASGVANRVQQAQSAANNTIQAQDALTRARTILDSAGAPNTGKGFETIKDLKNLMAGMGIDTQGASDANSLVKNLARYEAARATQAGLGGTDAARELAHNGSPNVSIDNTALKGIVTQSLATEKALAAYANIQGKAKDPGTLSKNESDFRNIPNLIEGYEYGLARSKAEADEFLRKHGVTAAQMAKTRQMIKEFESR